ncbi:FCD domain-containing protein [Paraburkholderia sp. SARCC-3016]|uniref:FCD domain-containing protein n=1 Tax=Paraburkholderia sp. SARCC-3016 TaxID=3058611 RepID=UPI002809E351|nr:FCD domain-containing protein [Paraburkholderia sp. SARCC-3016]MDQ7982075.1 FCD domain-containing protein [Paraburkholderia sp. SARCC-3016]
MSTPPATFPIKRQRLFDQVAQHLEAMILSGEVGVGDPLPSERELMERFGVGRPAVREALLWLNKKGLISVSAGERARVVEPDPSELLEHLSGAALLFASTPRGMQQFQQTRLFTEVALAREACRWTSADDLKRLEQLLRDNEASAGNMETFARTDDAFHFGIASLAHNPLIDALYRSVLSVLQDQRYTSLQHHDALHAAIDCHTRIFDAIAARDPDRAEQVMRTHLTNVETFYWDVRGKPVRRPPAAAADASQAAEKPRKKTD